MTVLFIINDAPYGNERGYNALRLAMALQKRQDPPAIRVFLMADAVGCAAAGQSTPFSSGSWKRARTVSQTSSSTSSPERSAAVAQAASSKGADNRQRSTAGR